MIADIGKSYIHELTPGDVEHFIRGLSSMVVKRDLMVNCFCFFVDLCDEKEVG